MQRVGLSASRRSSPQGVLFASGALARTMSAQQSSSSHELLHALESGSVGRTRQVLFNMPEGLKSSTILEPSHDAKHGLRTPLMAAAATGDVAVFTTIMHAFERMFSKNATKRGKQMHQQLLLHDRDGLTVAMHATRGGSTVVLALILAEIEDLKAYEALSGKDHGERTLLMHAAAAGKAPLFREVFHAMEMALTDEQLEESVEMRSGEDRTLLMISAGSGDKMAFKTCAESLRMVLFPSKFRAMMKARDADGMTFLMHAANPSNRRNDGQPYVAQPPNTSQPRQQSTPRSGTRAVPISYPAMHQRNLLYSDGESSTAPRVLVEGVSETLIHRSSNQQHAVEEGDAHESAGDVVGGDSRAEANLDGSVLPQRVRPSSPEEFLDSATPSVATQDVAVNQAGYDAGMAGGAGHGGRGGDAVVAAAQQYVVFTGYTLDPRVPVLKAAICLNKEGLWKEQARDMLTVKDSWGRTLISHGILSGSPQVFEEAFVGVRNDVLDEAVEELMECGDHYDNNRPLVMAKNTGRKEMESVVSKRINKLKRDIQLRAQASTLEAKIQSFIPGKLIVIFQLLLPEVSRTEGAFERLALLLTMSLLAPILAWASSLVTRRRSSNDVQASVPTRSFYSYALSAPAMFVWGVGTSNIFEDGWNWPESRSAAVLAVGTIVIPAVDGFVNSQRMEQWNDKFSFSRWRFSKQATIAWRKARAQQAKRVTYDRKVFQQPDLQNMIKAAAAAAPKFNLGGDGGSHHPFQEAVIESTQPRFATPPQAPAEAEQKSKEEV